MADLTSVDQEPKPGPPIQEGEVPPQYQVNQPPPLEHYQVDGTVDSGQPPPLPAPPQPQPAVPAPAPSQDAGGPPSSDPPTTVAPGAAAAPPPLPPAPAPAPDQTAEGAGQPTGDAGTGAAPAQSVPAAPFPAPNEQPPSGPDGELPQGPPGTRGQSQPPAAPAPLPDPLTADQAGIAQPAPLEAGAIAPADALTPTLPTGSYADRQRAAHPLGSQGDQTTAGDPILSDVLPMLGDIPASDPAVAPVLAQIADRLKQQADERAFAANQAKLNLQMVNNSISRVLGRGLTPLVEHGQQDPYSIYKAEEDPLTTVDSALAGLHELGGQGNGLSDYGHALVAELSAVQSSLRQSQHNADLVRDLESTDTSSPLPSRPAIYVPGVSEQLFLQTLPPDIRDELRPLFDNPQLRSSWQRQLERATRAASGTQFEFDLGAQANAIADIQEGLQAQEDQKQLGLRLDNAILSKIAFLPQGLQNAVTGSAMAVGFQVLMGPRGIANLGIGALFGGGMGAGQSIPLVEQGLSNLHPLKVVFDKTMHPIAGAITLGARLLAAGYTFGVDPTNPRAKKVMDDELANFHAAGILAPARYPQQYYDQTPEEIARGDPPRPFTGLSKTIADDSWDFFTTGIFTPLHDPVTQFMRVGQYYYDHLSIPLFTGAVDMAINPINMVGPMEAARIGGAVTSNAARLAGFAARTGKMERLAGGIEAVRQSIEHAREQGISPSRALAASFDFLTGTTDDPALKASYRWDSRGLLGLPHPMEGDAEMVNAAMAVGRGEATWDGNDWRMRSAIAADPAAARAESVIQPPAAPWNDHVKELYPDPAAFLADASSARQSIAVIYQDAGGDRTPEQLSAKSDYALEREAAAIPKLFVTEDPSLLSIPVTRGGPDHLILYTTQDTASLPLASNAAVYDAIVDPRQTRVFRTTAEYQRAAADAGGAGPLHTALRVGGYDTIYVPETTQGGGIVVVLDRKNVQLVNERRVDPQFAQDHAASFQAASSLRADPSTRDALAEWFAKPASRSGREDPALVGRAPLTQANLVDRLAEAFPRQPRELLTTAARFVELRARAMGIPTDQFTALYLADVRWSRAQGFLDEQGLGALFQAPDSTLQPGERPIHGLYSVLTQALDPNTQDSTTALMFQKRMQGAKTSEEQRIRTALGQFTTKDELAWSGVDDFLRIAGAGGQKVSLQELRDFVTTAGQVTFREILHGEAPTAPLTWNPIQGLPGGFASSDGRFSILERPQGGESVLFRTGGEYLGSFNSMEGAYQAAQSHIAYAAGQRQIPTEWGQYSLPGGSNYRELILTLPEQEVQGVTSRDGGPVGVVGPYQNRTHWGDTQNPFVHIRFKDFTDARGKLILQIEEMQSDPSQHNLKWGTAPDDARYRAMDQQREDLQQEVYRLTQSGEGYTDRRYELQDQIAELEYRMTNTNPATPLAATDAWTALGLRRMVVWAAEHGYDAIGFTPGSEQAKRYRLDQQVSRLEYDDLSGILTTVFPDGQADRRPISRFNLRSYIGEAAASRLLGQRTIDPAVKIIEWNGRWHIQEDGENLASFATAEEAAQALPRYDGSRTHVLEGDALAINDSGGMHTFYDETLPNAARKIGKPFGAQVQSTTLPLDPVGRHVYQGPIWTLSEIRAERERLRTLADTIASTTVAESGLTRRPLSRPVDLGQISFALSLLEGELGRGADYGASVSRLSPNAADYLGGYLVPVSEPRSLDVQTLPITPALRGQAKRGLALFQQDQSGLPRGATTFLPNARAVIWGFENANASTPFHELMHVFVTTLPEDELRILSRFVGADNFRDWTPAQHEKAARAFERYVWEGKAPTDDLKGIFAKAKMWMKTAYEAVKDIGSVAIPQDVRGVFDRMLTTPEDLAAAGQPRSGREAGARPAEATRPAVPAQDLIFPNHDAQERGPALTPSPAWEGVAKDMARSDAEGTGEGGAIRVRPKVNQARLQEMLAGKSYQGDPTNVIMKELLQNATDAVDAMYSLYPDHTPPEGARVSLAVDTQAGTVTIRDTGIGMSPDVLAGPYLDPFSTEKPGAFSRGGFGMAKVAIFGESQNTETVTVHQGENGKKIRSSIAMSGEDWKKAWLEERDDLIAVRREEVPASTPTGTVTRITMKPPAPDAPVNPYSNKPAGALNSGDAHYYLGNFLAGQKLRYALDLQVDGTPVAPSSYYSADNHVGTIDLPGGSLRFFISDRTQEATGVNVKVLNWGLPQFSMYINLDRQVPMPATIMVDVQPRGSTNSRDYPFTSNREQLVDAAKNEVERYIKSTLMGEAVNQERGEYVGAIQSAVPIPGVRGVSRSRIGTTALPAVSVLDTSQSLDPALTQRIARLPFTAEFFGAVDRVLPKMEERIGKRDASYRPVELGGWGLGSEYHGVNVPTESWTGSDHNMVLLNPFGAYDHAMSLPNIANSPQGGAAAWYTDLASEMAARAWSTTAHELAHQKASGHGLPMTQAMTEYYAYLVPGAESEINALKYAILRAMGSPEKVSDPHAAFAPSAGWKDFEQAHAEWQNNSYTTKKNVFERLLGSADQRQSDLQPAGAGGVPEAGAGGRLRPPGDLAGGVPDPAGNRLSSSPSPGRDAAGTGGADRFPPVLFQAAGTGAGGPGAGPGSYGPPAPPRGRVRASFHAVDRGELSQNLSPRSLGREFQEHWLDEMAAVNAMQYAWQKQNPGKAIPLRLSTEVLVSQWRGAGGAGMRRVEDMMSAVEHALGDVKNWNTVRDDLDEYLKLKHAISIEAVHGPQRLIQGGIMGAADAQAELDHLQSTLTASRWARLEAGARAFASEGERLLNDKVAAGIIDPNVAADLKNKYPYYAPIYAVEALENSGPRARSQGVVLTNNGLHGLTETGTDKDQVRPTDAMMLAMLRGEKAIRENAVTRGAAEVAVSLGVGSAVPTAPGSTPGHGNVKGTVSYFDNGQRKFVAVPDYLENELKRSSLAVTDAVVSTIARYSTGLLRAGAITYNPAFPLSNFMSDVLTATLTTQGRVLPQLLDPRVYADVIRHNLGGDAPYMQEMERKGTSMAGFFAMDPREAEQAVTRSGSRWLDNRSILDKLGQDDPTGWFRDHAVPTIYNPKNLARPLTALGDVNSTIGTMLEEVTRRAVFAAELRSRGISRADFLSGSKPGVSADDFQLLVAQAVQAQRRATLDFARAGSSARSFSQFLFLLNPGIQGLMAPIRSLYTDSNTSTSQKLLGMLTLGGLVTAQAALTAYNDSFPENQDVNQRIKDGTIYLHLPSDEIDPLTRRPRPRILAGPKTRELSILLGGVTRAIDLIKGQSPESWEAFVANTLGQSLPVNSPADFTIPQATLAVELMTNHDFFRGQDIIPSGLINKPKSQQYDSTTLDVFRALGGMLGVSPMMLQHFATNVFGGTGASLARAADYFLTPPALDPELQALWDQFQHIDPRDDIARNQFFSNITDAQREAISEQARRVSSKPLPIVGDIARRFLPRAGGGLYQRGLELAEEATGKSASQTQDFAQWQGKFAGVEHDAILQAAARLRAGEISYKEFAGTLSDQGKQWQGALTTLGIIYPQAAQGDSADWNKWQIAVATEAGHAPDRRSRGQILSAAYRSIDMTTDPQGDPDFDAFFGRQQAFEQSLTPADRTLLTQELEANYPPEVNQVRQDLRKLRDYWGIRDTTADLDPSWQTRAEALKQAPLKSQREQAILDSQDWKDASKMITSQREQYRRLHPDIDQLLVRYGYSTRTVAQLDAEKLADPQALLAAGRPVANSLLYRREKDLSAVTDALARVQKDNSQAHRKELKVATEAVDYTDYLIQRQKEIMADPTTAMVPRKIEFHPDSGNIPLPLFAEAVAQDVYGVSVGVDPRVDRHVAEFMKTLDYYAHEITLAKGKPELTFGSLSGKQGVKDKIAMLGFFLKKAKEGDVLLVDALGNETNTRALPPLPKVPDQRPRPAPLDIPKAP